MEQQAHDPDQQLTERYFLGELTADEAEAFEAHYFECTRCAENVVETQMMFDAGRAVASEPARVEPAVAPVVPIADRKRRWMNIWMPAASAAMLIIAATLPLLRRAPAVAPAVSVPAPAPSVPAPSMAIVVPRVVETASRAATEPLPLPLIFNAGEVVSLSVSNVLVGQTASMYEVRLLDQSGAIVQHERATRETLMDGFVGFGVLPAGSYSVVLLPAGGNPEGKAITTVPIEVRKQR